MSTHNLSFPGEIRKISVENICRVWCWNLCNMIRVLPLRQYTLRYPLILKSGRLHECAGRTGHSLLAYYVRTIFFREQRTQRLAAHSDPFSMISLDDTETSIKYTANRVVAYQQVLIIIYVLDVYGVVSVPVWDKGLFLAARPSY